MSKIASTKIAALVAKLRQAEHGGQYFSSDDVAGLIAELRSIGSDVKALEDRAVAERRGPPVPPPPPHRPPLRPGAVPVGTFVFIPAEGGRA